MVTTVLKFVPLAVIGVIGLFFVNGGNFTPFAPARLRAASVRSAGAALTLWAFIGLESATIPAEEVKDPERTLPRATIIGTVATTAVVHPGDGRDLRDHPDRRAGQLDAARSPTRPRSIFGGSWNKVIAAVAMISTFGALNGWILLQGRVPLAAARDGLFPARFANVHGSARTPVFGLVVSSVLLSGLMLMNYTSSLVDQFTFSHPAGDPDDARAVRLLGRGAGRPVLSREPGLLQTRRTSSATP